MNIFKKIRKPIFLKDVPSENEDINHIETLLDTLNEEQRKNAIEDIKKIKAGHFGEKSIEFELKHAGIPLWIIPDLYIEHNGLTAQIDFLVITLGKSYLIECKNMYGNILVNEKGEFLRQIGNETKRIYSPMTQCKRHLQVLKELRVDEKSNFITKSIFEHSFDKNYEPLVVFANSNCKINTRYAPKDISNKIISVDQLIDYIKKGDDPKEHGSPKTVENIAQFYLSKDKPNPKNYMKNYDNLEKSKTEDENITVKCEKCGSDMILREAKNGNNKGNKFYGCVSYPECKNIVNVEKKDTEKAKEEVVEPKKVENIEKDTAKTQKCDKCGCDMILREAKNGNNKGNKFYGCSSYPKCKNIKNIASN